MRYRFSFSMILLALLVSACQSPVAPTLIVMVVTATPETNTSVSPSATPTLLPTETYTLEAQPTQSIQPPTVAPVPTVSIFPTPTITQIQVAEQIFEHGIMFWIQANQQIWVMYRDNGDGGKWEIYTDSFLDGEPEYDPLLTPPAGTSQPLRGFGKLWRSNSNIQSKLGWSITPEFGYVGNYEYHPGGTVTNGTYQTGPGYHILFGLNGTESFRFDESNNSWTQLSN